MSSLQNKKVLVVGTGAMAMDYLKVLNDFACDVTVIGRSGTNAELIQNNYPGFVCYAGGLEKYLAENPEVPELAINAVTIGQLHATSMLLIKAGVKQLLLEKPGGLSVDDLSSLDELARNNFANVWIAYNRRFYASVKKLMTEVALDGGPSSAHFEFTEWLHTIDPAMFGKESLEKWIYSNSAHIIDAVFSIIGYPKELSVQVHGKNLVRWHPSGSIFTGMGVSEMDVPFTYHSNWQGPGRWAIEIITQHRRFYLKPIEKLQVQLKGSVAVDWVPIDDADDKNFKPGLKQQTLAFLTGDASKLFALSGQIRNFSFFQQIAGY